MDSTQKAVKNQEICEPLQGNLGITQSSGLDGHVVERDFSIRRAAADDEIAVHGHVLERHFVGANQDAAFDVLVISTLGYNVSADDVMENLRKFRARDVV